jgi:parallel beta-helix repeat protein
MCFVLFFAIVAYVATSNILEASSSASPSPSLSQSSTASPAITSPPSTTPMPTESPPPDLKTSITVPDDYPTISAAIDNAADGATIYVHKGIYEEQTLNINKSLSLIGDSADLVKINLNPPLVNQTIFTCTFLVPSTAIKINADDVKLSGFTIDAPGGLSVSGDRIELTGNVITQGNLVLNGSFLTIENNRLSGRVTLTGSNQTFAQNVVHGIEINGSYNNISGNTMSNSDVNLSFDSNLQGSFNIITGNSFSVLYMEYSNANIISNNSFRCIWIGFYGHSCSNNTFSGNTVKGPGLWGILMGAGSYNIFYDNYIADFGGDHDGYGIAIGGNHLVAENNLFYHNTLVNNNKGVGYNWGLEGTGNSWDNGEEGNYWSDYTGSDDNGDGIGDTPYVIDDNNIDNYPLMAPFNNPK